jgi:hypothetical protein
MALLIIKALKVSLFKSFFLFKKHNSSFFLILDYNQEFDAVTTSDVYSDYNNSLIYNEQNMKKQNAPLVNELKNNNLFKKANGTSQPMPSTKYSNFNDETGMIGINTNSDDKLKNYQRLSNSINNLFSNLLQQLEKQKNKDYTDHGSSHEKLNQTELLNSSSVNNNSHKESNFSSQTPSPSSKTQYQCNNSKDSNKDSGFNQESMFFNSPTKNGEFNDKYSLMTKSKQIKEQTDIKNDENEISLLERYLNNEQLIAFKHSQIESILHKHTNLFLDDFSIVEYILNQEGISFKTFKQSIKEKYTNLEWSDSLLYKLHDVINQSPDKTVNSYNNNDGDEDDEEDEDTYYPDEYGNKSFVNGNRNGFDKEKKFDYILKQVVKTNAAHDSNEVSNSPTSSSRSYRKIKDIKNATNKKKQQLMLNSDSSEAAFSVNENNIMNHDSLRNTLDYSFAQRRERKGSLPEINIIGFENNNYEFQSSYLSFGNSTLNNNINSNGNKYPTVDMYRESPKTLNDSQKNNTITVLRNNNAIDKRYSRKSAFVLEVMRTSMFRSKSLTDLNSSLVKSENNFNKNGGLNHNLNNNNSILSNKFSSKSIISTNTLNNSQSINHLNMIKTDSMTSSYTANTSSLFRSNLSFNENYTGIIWQCADMAYNEYRNKYKELKWLMNGSDNISTNSKLKEVEQRLKIELNLREKNIAILEEMNKDNGSNSKS